MTSEVVVAFVVSLPGLLALLVRAARLERKIKHLERRVTILETLQYPNDGQPPS